MINSNNLMKPEAKKIVTGSEHTVTKQVGEIFSAQLKVNYYQPPYSIRNMQFINCMDIISRQ